MFATGNGSIYGGESVQAGDTLHAALGSPRLAVDGFQALGPHSELSVLCVPDKNTHSETLRGQNLDEVNQRLQPESGPCEGCKYYCVLGNPYMLTLRK